MTTIKGGSGMSTQTTHKPVVRDSHGLWYWVDDRGVLSSHIESEEAAWDEYKQALIDGSNFGAGA